MPQAHTDADYAAHAVGSLCMPYTPHSITDHGDAVAVKYFLTNVGDVLRRVFLAQHNPFVDKAAVHITVLCGGVRVADMTWAAWQAAQRTHDMCNELLFLDAAGRHIKWPMHALSQDCLCIIVRMPKDMWACDSPRDVPGWLVLTTWDMMDPEWRRAKTCHRSVIDMATPHTDTFMVEGGELRYARQGLAVKSTAQLARLSKRRSNPCY